MKTLYAPVSLLISLVLVVSGCEASDPVTEDLYFTGIHATTTNTTSIYAESGQISDVIFGGDILPAHNNVSLGDLGRQYKNGWFESVYSNGVLLTPTQNSSGNATWGGITGTLSNQTDIQSALDAKQATLVSGTNIKTVNGSTLLGAGDLVVSAGAETDPIFSAHASTNVTPTLLAAWNLAYAWGNHALQGYLTALTSQNVTDALGYQPADNVTAMAHYGDTAGKVASVGAQGALVSSGGVNPVIQWAAPLNSTNITTALGFTPLDKAIGTTKGDVISFSAASTPVRVASTAVNNDVLMVDTSTASGLKFATPTGAPDSRLIVDAVASGEQHDVTASTALTKVTVIDVPLTAGTYTFQYYVIYRSNQTANGVRLAVNYSGTNGAFVWNWSTVSTISTASNAAADQDAIIAASSVTNNFASRAKSSTTRGVTISVDTINADMLAIVEGVFIATGSGNLELWHGNYVATAGYTTSVMPGTSVVVTKTK